MKPTRRGYGLLIVMIAGIVLGAAFGARSLNAIVVPGAVALGAGALQLYRAASPSLERSQPEPGFPGETRTVDLTIRSSVPCTVQDTVGAGLTADGVSTKTPGNGRLTYELTLRQRGEHPLGPATVVTTDVFGLFARRFSFDVKTAVLVYPAVRRLAPAAVGQGGIESSGRGAFDRLREYVPGDPLRDVHWRTSAKRPPEDLLVAEYTADEEAGVMVAADSPIASTDAADAMAEATASLVLSLLDSGVAVGIVTPTGRVTEGTGRRHRRELLELLALTTTGVLDAGARNRADFRIVADGDGVQLHHQGRRRPFDDLVVEEGAPPA